MVIFRKIENIETSCEKYELGLIGSVTGSLPGKWEVLKPGVEKG